MAATRTHASRWITSPCAAVLVLSLSAGLAQAQTIWYVDDDAPPGGEGSSWAEAFDSLDLALEIATSRDQIWVAQGTYTPTRQTDPMSLSSPTGDPLDATFKIPMGVRLYGGFAGTETSLAQRARLFDQTILDGSIVLSDGTQAKVHHVVFYHSNGQSGPSGRLDGFVVRNGDAQGSSVNWGGGLLAGNTDNNGFVGTFRFALANCLFQDNHAPARGGGAAFVLSAVVPVRDCTFLNNSANLGAGMYVNAGVDVSFVRTDFIGNAAHGSGGAFKQDGPGSLGALPPRFVNCSFVGNSAGTNGGAIDWHAQGVKTPMDIINCLFDANDAARGGAIWIQGGRVVGSNGIVEAGTATVWHSTFVNNSASTQGGAIDFDKQDPVRSTATISNSIFWGNASPSMPNIDLGATVVSSDVQGGYAGGTLIFDTDPLFVDPSGGDYRLASFSPLIDAAAYDLPADEFDLDSDGNTAEPLPLDLDGLPRTTDDPIAANAGSGIVPWSDLGPYEFDRGCTADLSGSIDPADPLFGVPDGRVDATDFFYYLDRFAAGDLAVADLTGSLVPGDPGFAMPDGILDSKDFFFYLNTFALGCP